MFSITDLKTGVVIELEGAPYEVVKYQHSKMGRGGAVLRTTLKNLLTGGNIERTFHGDEKFAAADITSGQAQFLYQDGDEYTFMDTTSFEQFPISRAILGQDVYYLSEGHNIEIRYYRGRPISILLPAKMKFKITEADPAVKGDTVTNPSKNATIETGLTLKVPMFVKVGDTILIDTRGGSYIERAN
ncbi:elongation factor P [candidate division Kazan bacterium RIFCSPHIGHO2_01_FULL_49_10]|uniref:Elongation factor P n=1 Tax=candidate division Kazan bacterium RIFCSPLOWO2_01_FULL_48_13 TaxID=1798539 RepID=A0A1F4PQV6_UNCK3|nr:MAG: elongation factor P [candidate division Kazan bacterium RIFCSPHIGHO2_01_FULL_49_10]OGB85432.1 MAG: elongation factor P [candidate division Kazan bacterium RIFCSPLOWO2_01_FULL_48_13]